jgi:hypothetical protein
MNEDDYCRNEKDGNPKISQPRPDTIRHGRYRGGLGKIQSS